VVFTLSLTTDIQVAREIYGLLEHPWSVFLAKRDLRRRFWFESSGLGDIEPW